MTARRRAEGMGRQLPFLLALVAIALRLLAPPGYMPGTSLARPVMLCPDGGAMPGMAMDHGGHHAPGKAPPHGDHPCLFAGLAAATFGGTPDAAPLPPPAVAGESVSRPARTTTPGRGLAAPPPPSHAPPVLRA